MCSRDQQEGGSDTLVLPDYGILFGILVCFCLGADLQQLPSLSLLLQEVALSRFGPK